MKVSARMKAIAYKATSLDQCYCMMIMITKLHFLGTDFQSQL